jgi:hypothetical protein
MCITRETAHVFATSAPGKSPRLRRVIGTEPDETRESPLGLLRCAQLRALGVDAQHAPLVSQHLLPPVQFADADEELLLLDAVRFLVAQRMFSAHDASSAAAPALSVAPLQDEAVVMLADIGFFLHAQLRAAEARGQPLRDAFSFSGRTLASVTRLAAQHRREALVDFYLECMYGGYDEFYFTGHQKVRGVWREPLAWDDECERMLDDDDEMEDEREALRRITAKAPHPGMHWAAAVELQPTSSDRTATLHGEWCMAQLRSPEAIRKEGREQHNCLRYMHWSTLDISDDSSYWSLRFTPDAAGAAQLKADDELRQAAAQLRLTVHVADGYVAEAQAPDNDPPPLAALKALAEWGHHAGVDVPQYNGGSDGDDR